MRAIFGACLAFTLIAGPASKAPAQGLVEYALILVLAVSGPGGPQVIGIIPSTVLAEDLCEEPAPDAEVLCAALADLELGMPGAAALSVGFGAGLQRLQFEPLPPALPRESKPLLIIAEDVEGEALAHGRYHGRYYVRSVVHTLQGGDSVDLITCDYRHGRLELAHVVQQRGGIATETVAPPDEAALESCADAIQESLFDGLSMVAATPFASIQNDTAARHGEFDLVQAETAPSNGLPSFEVVAYLILMGPPPPQTAAASESVSGSQ